MSTGPVESMFSTMELLRRHRNAKFDDERKRTKATQDDEDRAFEVGERDRGLETRRQLEQAAAPVQVGEGVYQPAVDDDGNAMPANPAAGGTVQGRGFATREQADAEAAKLNTSQAQVSRMSDVLMRRGNPEAAQKLRTGAVAERTGEIKLSEAEREEALASYRDELRQKVPFGDWKAMAEFASNSKFDGAGGEVKYDWRPSQDGTSYELFVKAKELPWAPTGTRAANTPEGFAEQMMHLEKLPIDKVLLHLDRKQQRADNKAYRDELLKDKDEAAAQRKVEFDARMAHLRSKGSGSAGGGVAGDGETVDLAAIDKEIESQLGGKDGEGNPIKPDLRARQVIRALAARSPEAVNGDPRGAAIAAMRMYDDALKRSGGNHEQAMQRIAVAIDMAKSGTPGAMVQLGGGKPEAVGAVGTGAPAAAAPGARQPARVAMQQIAEQERARREAQQAQEAQRRAAVESEIAAANQLTLEQLRAMSPDQAFALLNSPAGRALPEQVRQLLRAQSQGARLNTGRGFGAKL